MHEKESKHKMSESMRNYCNFDSPQTDLWVPHIISKSSSRLLLRYKQVNKSFKLKQKTIIEKNNFKKKKAIVIKIVEH